MIEQLRLLDDDKPKPVSDGDCQMVIRESRRAKSLILQMLPPYTLEVVVPRGTKPRAVKKFIDENHRWIEKAQSELRTRYPAERIAPPTEITFAAVAARWDVRYEEGRGEKSRLRSVSNTIEIETAMPNDREVYELLRKWLLAQARIHLKPWIIREARRLGVQPNSVSVRTQRTRWGSCSPRGNVSINASLLFVEPELVRYLFVHELCHLRHLDHSKRFWNAVARYEPQFKSLDRRLTDAWSVVPVWALQRSS